MKNRDAIIAFMGFCLFALSCGGDITNSYSRGIKNIEIRFIYGYIYSDFMPPIPADPIRCGLRFEIINRSETEIIDSLKIENCQVFLSNNTLLGNITMKSQNEIYIEPQSIDTVWYYKIQEDHPIFDSPCDEEVYMQLIIVDKYNNFLRMRTNILEYWCLM